MSNIGDYLKSAQKLNDELLNALDKLPGDFCFPERKIPPPPSTAQCQQPCVVKLSDNNYIPPFYNDPNDVSIRSTAYIVRYEGKIQNKSRDPNYQMNIDQSMGEPNQSSVVDSSRWDALRKRMESSKKEETSPAFKNMCIDKEAEQRRREEELLNEIERKASENRLFVPTFPIEDSYFIKP